MAFSNDDILILAKAGFNAAQIAALNMTAAPAAQAAPAPAAPAPAAPAAPAVPAAPAAPAAPAEDPILAALNRLTTTIQAQAIQQTTLPQQEPQTPEQILAQIINPEPPKEVK